MIAAEELPKSLERLQLKSHNRRWNETEGAYLGRAGRTGESRQTWRRRGGWEARHRGRLSWRRRRRAGKSYRRRPPPGWRRPAGGSRVVKQQKPSANQRSPNRSDAQVGRGRRRALLGWRGGDGRTRCGGGGSGRRRRSRGAPRAAPTSPASAFPQLGFVRRQAESI